MNNHQGSRGSFDRTFRQIAMCLLAGGRGEALEELVARGISEPFDSYCLALKLAREGKVDEALERLRTSPAGAEDPEVRQLAFRLLIHQANLYMRRQDFAGLSKVMDEALRLMPDAPETEQELSYFPQMLPFCHLLLGSREKTAALWRKEFWQIRDAVLHKLALLYYWSARHAEEQQISEGNLAPESLNALWQKTIAFWVALSGSQEFWEHWAQRRAAVYEREISSEEITEMRKKLVEDWLVGILHQFMDAHQQAGRSEDSKRHQRYLTQLRLERRAVSTWHALLPRLTGVTEALHLNLGESVSLVALVQAVQNREGYQPCFGSAGTPDCPDCSWEHLCRHEDLKQDIPLPLKTLGGPLMNREMGLAGLVTRILLLQLEHQRDDAEAERLAIYLSPLGLAAVWLEERHPEQALQELQKLNADIRQTPRARYIRMAALAERGRRTLEAHGLEAAFRDWQEVKQEHQEIQGQPSTLALKRLLANLLDELSGWVTDGALREARGLKSQKKTNEAIHILKKALELASSPEIKDHLADLYCDRAFKFLGDNKVSEARQDFENALKVKSDFNRAREGISTSYNNEGVDVWDAGRLEEGIRLLEKALTHNPNNNVAKRNLAKAFREKAIKKVNNELGHAYSIQSKRAILGEAVSLLKKAHDYDPTNDQIIKDCNDLIGILNRI